MTLLGYIKSLKVVELNEFAARCGTSPAYLEQVARGYRRAGEYLCINIDRETKGEIRCEELRPDVDWAYIRSTGIPDKAA